MKLLTIDTSSSVCSIALTDGEILLGEYLVAGGKGASSRLFEGIGRLLSDCGVSMPDLDGFGVTRGPGAFTGLRVGVAAVKGLSLATGKPVAGFSSLAMLAMNIPMVDMPVCAMYDARKSEIYAGIYTTRSGFPELVKGDEVISPEALSGWISGPTIFVGDGAVRYQDRLVELLRDNAMFAPANQNIPRASNGAAIALAALKRGDQINPADLLPCYLRLSEAELDRIRKATTGSSPV